MPTLRVINAAFTKTKIPKKPAAQNNNKTKNPPFKKNEKKKKAPAPTQAEKKDAQKKKSLENGGNTGLPLTCRICHEKFNGTEVLNQHTKDKHLGLGKGVPRGGRGGN